MIRSKVTPPEEFGARISDSIAARRAGSTEGEAGEATAGEAFCDEEEGGEKTPRAAGRAEPTAWDGCGCGPDRARNIAGCTCAP